MISKEVLAHRLVGGSLGFTSSLVEQALGSDILRGIVMDQLEKHIMAQVQTYAHPGLPTQARTDKLDMTLALIRSAERALERKQLSHPVLHRLLHTLLANMALGQDREAQLACQRFAESHEGQAPPTLMVISPTKKYYRNNNLNLPEQYHNGGIWPFVGGFYVAALVKAGRLDEARRQLEKLAEVNRQGAEFEWEFNEWCHGRTGQPMGYPHQAWSAGMYIFACHCVVEERVMLLS